MVVNQAKVVLKYATGQRSTAKTTQRSLVLGSKKITASTFGHGLSCFSAQVDELQNSQWE